MSLQGQQDHTADNEATLWPPADYEQQVSRLCAAIGQEVFLAEMNETAINMGVKISDHALVLLAVIDFPHPDPYRQLCPHMLIFDDGRGINLGRIARISIGRAFGPTAEQTLYQNHAFIKDTLFAPRALSRELIAETTKAILSEVLGDKPGRLLESCYQDDNEMINNDKINLRRLKRS